MSELSDYEITRSQMERAGSDGGAGGPLRTFDLGGLTWERHDGVFPPDEFASTGLFADMIPYPVGGSFLEMGCGTGVIAVRAALAGCQRVTAVDVSPGAVADARANARRHGVADRVEVVESDVFDAVDPADRYDVVFWNSNFVAVPGDYDYASMYERAFFDPGYRCHRRYIEQGGAFLAERGRLLIGFSDLGDLEALREIAAGAGRVAQEVETRVNAEERDVRYVLIDLRIKANI